MHWRNVAERFSVHRTEGGALDSLIASLAEIVGDHNRSYGDQITIEKPGARNWLNVLDDLQNFHSAQGVDAEIIETILED